MLFGNLKTRVQDNLNVIFLGRWLMRGSAPHLTTSSGLSTPLPALPLPNVQALLSTTDQKSWLWSSVRDYMSEEFSRLPPGQSTSSFLISLM